MTQTIKQRRALAELNHRRAEAPASTFAEEEGARELERKSDADEAIASLGLLYGDSFE